MKIKNSQSRMERRDSSENRIKRVKQIAGFVMMLVCLVGVGPVGSVAKADSQVLDSSPVSDGTLTLLENGEVLVAGLGTALFDPATRTWSYTGNLEMSRLYHTATLLQNGKVLIAGGDDARTYDDDDNAITSVELYDPVTGTWNSKGSLITARYYHTATLLPNGKVLVAGGFGGFFYSALDSAELYDPDTGTWSATGSLNDARFGHTATLLRNGKVLVVGGTQGGNLASGLASTETYDPDTGTWSKSGNLDTPRSGHTATLLQRGKVLVASGDIGYDGHCTQTDAAELYDPDTETWSSAGSLSKSRSGHTATLLSTGKVLVAGGLNVTCTPNGSAAWGLYSSEVYDPEAGTWSRGGDLSIRRFAHSAVLLPDGTVLMLGGAVVEVYDPDTSPTTPIINIASVSGKKLFVVGRNFDDGAVILLNGEEQDTGTYDEGARPTLIAKRSGKKVRPGDKIQVRNANGSMSQELIFKSS